MKVLKALLAVFTTLAVALTAALLLWLLYPLSVYLLEFNLLIIMLDYLVSMG